MRRSEPRFAGGIALLLQELIPEHGELRCKLRLLGRGFVGLEDLPLVAHTLSIHLVVGDRFYGAALSRVAWEVTDGAQPGLGSVDGFCSLSVRVVREVSSDAAQQVVVGEVHRRLAVRGASLGNLRSHNIEFLSHKFELLVGF